MSEPKVTVLMPVYNAAQYLSAALASVWSQTFKNFELLVIDDASSDDSPAILAAVSDPRLRVIRNEKNLGIAKTLNRGLREARGIYIARLDADDVAMPHRLAHQAAFLDARPEVVVVGGGYVLLNGSGREYSTLLGTDVRTPGTIAWKLLWQNPFAHPSVMFRHQAALAVNGYPENRPHSEDYGLWVRMTTQGALSVLPEKIIQLRKHHDNITTHNAELSILSSLDNSAEAIRLLTGITVQGTPLAGLCFPGRASASSAGLDLVKLLDTIAQAFLRRTALDHAEIKGIRQVIAQHFWILSQRGSRDAGVKRSAVERSRQYDHWITARHAPLLHYFFRPCEFSL